MTSSTHATDQNEHEESKSGGVILYLSFSILVACVLKIIFSKILRNKVPLPFTVAVLLISFIISFIITKSGYKNNAFVSGEIELSAINPHLILYIFLPLLIFDSSFNGHFHVIKQQLLSAILLAGPGIIITTAIIAVCAIYIFPYEWSWVTGLMFGSILSATDPIAVVALLHDSGASRSLAALIDSESLLNDGSAFVLFLIFNDIVRRGNANAKDIAVQIIKYSIGGPAFGLACGIVSVIILNKINNELEVEITFTFGLAYLIFYVADAELVVSAVLAIVVMGLYMSKYKYCISSNVQESMTGAWKIAAYITNILIFALTGIILVQLFVSSADSINGKDFGFSIVLYIIIHIGRALTVLILFPFMKWTGVSLTWKDCVVLIWSGLRGSMSLIMVLFVRSNENIRELTRNQFLFHISMIVLLTLVINGTSSKYLVKILGLHRGTKESEIVILQAFEHIRRRTSQKLSEMKNKEDFADVDWKMLNAYLPDKLLEELDERNDTDFHRKIVSTINANAETNNNESNYPTILSDDELKSIPTIYQIILNSNNSKQMRQTSTDTSVIFPITNDHGRRSVNDENIRKEVISRFLTAVAVDYEKQWSLGMVRRKTLNILIKSAERAKEKCSLELHWKIIIDYFRLPFLLQFLIKFDYFNLFRRWKYHVLFDHTFRTIELALSFHAAQARMDNIRVQFPELSNLNERIVNEVYAEAKLYQLQIMHVLADLHESYRLCWTTQITRRCALMLLKYESRATTDLHETGILADNEYTRIIELIENKLFSLEYGGIQIYSNQKKTLENSFDLIPYFKNLPPVEKVRWKYLLKSEYSWFQPDTILLESGEPVSRAYLIVRGIVKRESDLTPNYYRCGSIVGIDALFSNKSQVNYNYTTHGGVVEAYFIDTFLLNSLLSDENLSRLIYDEIAVHMITDKFSKFFNLTHSQMKMLLAEYATFYNKKSDLTIDLRENERLFLLSGSMDWHMNNKRYVVNSIHFIQDGISTKYKLRSYSIGYRWTKEHEDLCFDKKKFKFGFPIGDTDLDNILKSNCPHNMHSSMKNT